VERLRTRSHQARALEWALVLLFILALMWVVMGRFDELKDRAVETVARYEYQLLQTRIQIYRIRRGRWPPSLKAALPAKPAEVLMVGPGSERHRLTDSDGRLVDPFGAPYRYHPDSGELEIPQGLARKPHED